VTWTVEQLGRHVADYLATLAVEDHARPEEAAMANKVHTTEATTTPFDVRAWIQGEDRAHPGFAAMVDAELAALRLEDRLRELRRATRLTQAALAKRVGISQAAVAQMERGEPGRMEIRTLTKLATAMGYTVEIEFKPTKALTSLPARGKAQRER
jgi:DNA-binding XRE family transcriptional regulator